jgi:formylglycine-generating enzyme required for sulfatase activity
MRETCSSELRRLGFSPCRGSKLRFVLVLLVLLFAVVPLSCSSVPRSQRTRPNAQPKTIRSKTGIEMVWIPPGTFTMGSTDAEIQAAYEDSKRAAPQYAKLDWFTGEKPRHQVAILKGFYMGKYEVTQGQWQAVMGTTVQQQNGEGGSNVEPGRRAG